MEILSNLPALIFLVVLIGFLAFTGFRLGLPFLVRRIAGLIFVLGSASFVTFVLGLFAPTSALEAQLGNRANPETLAKLNQFYGLDRPWWEQYWNFLTNLLHFSLGRSWANKAILVSDMLGRQLPISLQLGLISAVLAVTVGVSLGLFAAVRANTRYDTAIQGFALFFFALPTFVLIPFFWIGNYFLYIRDIPHLPSSSTDFGFDHLDQMIAPVAILSVVQIAFYVRLTRTSMLEVLRQDYVRTARAKGLGERAVLWRHAFRNAMLPLITALGPALAYVVNGAFITEGLFNIQGIGTTTLGALTNYDFPVVQGTVMLLATAVAFMNLVTDVIYGVVDPRIKSV
jgi:ABC-type dipeptide/oligopeptide/nickel transport system permease component